MPQDKDFKRIVRLRMASTGEPYTAARAALTPDPAPLRRNVWRWLQQLADPSQAPAAYAALKAMPEEKLRPAALAGLDHHVWRVRRSCCRLLDDLTLTPESTAALERCLEDAHPRVRRAALHTLSCIHCKPDSCALDVRGVFERMASDSSRDVRAAIVEPLTWAYDEPWALDLLRRFAEGDPSHRLRERAQSGIANLGSKLRSNELRQELPPDLRAKTERHRGKWIAIADGRIIAVDGPGAALRRELRAKNRPDAALYWVSST
jgi:HEAT repeat protein